jgi:hypothetical protein
VGRRIVKKKIRARRWKSFHTSQYLWDCRGFSLQQYFEDNMTMSVIITSWDHSQSVRPSQSTFITGSSDEAAMTTNWLHQLPTVSVDKKKTSWVSVAFLETMGKTQSWYWSCLIANWQSSTLQYICGFLCTLYWPDLSSEVTLSSWSKQKSTMPVGSICQNLTP